MALVVLWDMLLSVTRPSLACTTYTEAVQVLLSPDSCCTDLQHSELNAQADAVHAQFAPVVEQAVAAVAQAAEAAAPVAKKVQDTVAPAAEQGAMVMASATAAARTAAVAAVAEAAAAGGPARPLGQVVEGAADQAVQVSVMLQSVE